MAVPDPAATAKRHTRIDPKMMSSFSGSVQLPAVIPEYSAEDIDGYIEARLAEDIEERSALAARMREKAGGVQQWAIMATTIANEASQDGISGEVIMGMLDDIAPTTPARMDDLYVWKLSRLSPVEKAQALVVMQWVVLAPEALRLNDLLVALRLTFAMRRNKKGGLQHTWDENTVLDLPHSLSLRDLAENDEASAGIPTDSPTLFWKWVQHISQGMLELDSSARPEAKIQNEPLGKKHLRAVHDSVLRFFRRGRGFQTLLAPPSGPKARLPSTDRMIDISNYTLLHACLEFLNMTEFNQLDWNREAESPIGTDGPMLGAVGQIEMPVSSYSFLRYVANNLVFHLLCPRQLRYFLPQVKLLELLTANNCRIWRRWTHLLGFSIHAADSDAILNDVNKGKTQRLLQPVYGAKYRLARVLRRAWKIAISQQQEKTLTRAPSKAARLPRFTAGFGLSSDSIIASLHTIEVH
ncbi:hypothetical protein BD289DRAFT_454720 [Coniella lustricola]|uniref:Uncharacterized protein n=1 Tax=Coniella lustricola TaxID=2025994 RepID=A0A2T3A2H3_9PEZI|nr:hypothetical protein BD289DRAFT_454720 [Coniella lustricola]